MKTDQLHSFLVQKWSCRPVLVDDKSSLIEDGGSVLIYVTECFHLTASLAGCKSSEYTTKHINPLSKHLKPRVCNINLDYVSANRFETIGSTKPTPIFYATMRLSTCNHVYLIKLNQIVYSNEFPIFHLSTRSHKFKYLKSPTNLGDFFFLLRPILIWV